MSLSLALVLIGAQNLTPKAVFVSHSELTEAQKVVLEQPTESDTRKWAERQKLVVEKIGDAIIIRDENLFDIKRFDNYLRAVQFLTEFVRQGKGSFRMKDLNSDIRPSVYQLLVQKRADEDLGAALNDDNTVIGLEASIGIEVTAGGKTALGWAQRTPAYNADDKSYKSVAQSDLDKYEKDERPKLRPPADMTQVTFQFSKRWVVSSAERMELATDVSKLFADRLREQREAYYKVQASIADALKPTGVAEGMKAKGLPMDIQNGLKRFGFGNLSGDIIDTTDFLENGTVTKIYGGIWITTTATVDGKRRSSSRPVSSFVRGG
jgi:hypothetical protein